jgi:hypothetical protein
VTSPDGGSAPKPPKEPQPAALRSAVFDIPWVLARPPWIFRKSPRPVEPVLVKTKKSEAVAEALAQFTNGAVFGGWRPDNDARAWAHYEAHVEATLLAIIPIAIGEWNPKRKIAERIVRILAQRHLKDVQEAAATYGKKAKASVEEILTIDPRLDCPGAPPDMSPAWKPKTLPRPRLVGGDELSFEAVEHLGHMLAFSTLDRPYAGIADVKAACEPRSLAELAWEAAIAWEDAGAGKRDEWMIESLAHFADDVVIRRTTPALKSARVLDVLAATPTDAAATELCTILWRLSQDKPKPSYGVKEARAAFAALARRRGMSVDELEDTLAPTILPAPPIKFGVDDRLDPFMQTAGGTRHHTLPPTSTWKDLQEDVAAVSDMRIRSLERAMISGRSWSVETFRKAWLDHTLMQHVSRCVVWRTGDRMFRVAEDGSFADAGDDVMELGKTVAIAHPAEMKAEERTKWIAVLADYRVVQPFEQMARRVLPPVKGSSVALFPAGPTTQREIHEKLTAHGFAFDYRGTQPTRACARTSGRMCLELAFKNQSLTSATLRYARGTGAWIDLDAAHHVDICEVAHDLDLTLRASAP